MAFKQKGFPSHKGVKKSYSGFHKGKAVFKSHEPGHEESEMKYGDTEWGDWKKGETTQTDTGTTRTDTRTGVQKGAKVEKLAETAEEKAAYAKYLEDVDAGKVKRNTKYDDREVTDTRTETTEDKGMQGNLYGHGGTSNVRVHGSASDLGYTGSMEVDPDKKYHLDEAITSYIPEIYEGGKYKGQGERVNFKDFEFYDNPELQQLLTNVNFETAASGGTKGRGFRGAQESDYGQALMEIASSDNPEAAYTKYIEQHPELSVQPEGTTGVNPLQNQTSAEFITGEGAKDAASKAHGTDETFQQVRDRIAAEREAIRKRKEMEAKNISYQGSYKF